MSGAVGRSLFRCKRFAGEFAVALSMVIPQNRSMYPNPAWALSNDGAIGVGQFSWPKSVDLWGIWLDRKSENSVLFRNSVNVTVCDFITRLSTPPLCRADTN